MITVIGESLIDLVGTTPHVGGSPLNVAIGLSRLGHPTRFVTRFGRDEYGALIAAHLAADDVALTLEPDAGRTSVATVHLDERGAASYDFDLDWSLPAVDEVLRVEADARADADAPSPTLTHVGSIATTLQPGAATVLELVERLRPASTITFDPNARPTIVGDVAYAVAQAEAFVRASDVVKASDEDLLWLYPDRRIEETAAAWLALGPAVVAVTRGSEGGYAVARSGAVSVPSVRTQLVDTVGAGDSFMAAMLCWVVDNGLDGPASRDALRAVSAEQLQDLLGFAASAAAITVSRAGANPPTRAELAAAL
ncbi:carbohydrate kinase family protein [Plantibacter sp. YIM 135249]|uniref:carbohydrate kinase family protein n=1 Tax=Plantibacter sp. YIM 135249 TaxID=3423918 RepID=UPI003D32E37E